MKKTKIFIAFVVLAFIIGLLPTIADFAAQIVSAEADGLALTPYALKLIKSITLFLKKYIWHIVGLYAVFIAFVIFMENQNPDRTIIWVAVLIFLPVIGVAVYLAIGPSFSGYKRRMKYSLTDTSQSTFSADGQEMTGRVIQAVSGSELRQRNRFRLLFDGDETFGAIKKELGNAKRCIHLESFIINDDGLGREIRDILVEAAKRGVKVRVLYDAIGCRKITRPYVESLRNAGCECISFMPMSFVRFRRLMNFRNHRKIIVVDGRVAFMGGLNIGDEYLGKGKLGFWRDTHCRVEGEIVNDLNEIFISDWNDRTHEDLETLRKDMRPEERESNFENMPVIPIQCASSGVNTAWHVIRMAYFSLIMRAKKKVWITTPYLVPGPQIMSALQTAALSGVDVRVIIPSTKDHFLVYWAGRGNIEPLLRAGVRVYLYKKGFIHAKTLLSDDGLCSVGSCNFDVRSLEINHEVQLFVYDNLSAKILEEHFVRDFADSEEMTLEKWTARPFGQKIKEAFGKLYSAQI